MVRSAPPAKKLLAGVMNLLALNLEEGTDLNPTVKIITKRQAACLSYLIRASCWCGSNKGNVSSLEPRVYALVKTSQAESICIYELV